MLLPAIRSVVKGRPAANPLESKACSRGRHQASRCCRDAVRSCGCTTPPTGRCDRSSVPVMVATMYVCGITPYDATHLGHAATYLTFDLVHRLWLDAGLG